MVVVARDARGVEQAAYELLKTPYLRERAEKLRRLAEGTANAERVLAQIDDEQSLADGYYVRAYYLFWLDSTLEYSPAAPGELLADDVEGLRVIASARARFQREFASCPRCQKWNERGGVGCEHCGQKFGRGGNDASA